MVKSYWNEQKYKINVLPNRSKYAKLLLKAVNLRTKYQKMGECTG